MSLESSLSIANASLANINSQLGVISNNVANASTPDYSVETPNQESLVAGTIGLGVQTVDTGQGGKQETHAEGDGRRGD